MNKVVLDTNSLRKLSEGWHPLVQALENCQKVQIPVIVLGELFVGFKGGSREVKNIRDLEDLLNERGIETIGLDRETAEIYARIAHELRIKGRPIPANDLWIAASAIETGAVLITYDSHFRDIAGLRIWGE